MSDERERSPDPGPDRTSRRDFLTQVGEGACAVRPPGRSS